jgi:hypothetical protein
MSIALISNGESGAAVRTKLNSAIAQINSGSFDIVYSTNNGNGTNFAVGDDIWIGDANLANTMQLSGQQTASVAYIRFGSGSSRPFIGSTTGGVLTISGSTSVLIGTQATTTRFSDAAVIVSSIPSAIQHNESGSIGIIGEAIGKSALRNAGVYGAGYTSGSWSCQGVIGEGHVSSSGDTAPAVGVRGYANDTHTGGLNVGLYGDATGGSANYALYLNSGNIFSAAAQTWTLASNTAALNIQSGLLNLDTTNTKVTVSGSLTVNDILVLTPRTTTPSGAATGSLIMSGSAGTVKPYYFNGTTWTALV